MQRAGYYKYKACQKGYLRQVNVEKRAAFTLAIIDHDVAFWKAVRFTDEVYFDVDSRRAEFVIRNYKERYYYDCIQYNKRSRGSQLHCWAIVGYNYKSELVFYDTYSFDYNPSYEVEATEQHVDDEEHVPALVKETLAEEARLLGNNPTCNHRCRDKQACKHACCKARVRRRAGGNLTQ